MEVKSIDIDTYLKQTLSLSQPKHQLYGKIMSHMAQLCSIPQSSFVILGSYPMRQYKSIGDLDIDMDSSQFNKLKLLNSQYISYSIHAQSKQTIWQLQLSQLYSNIKTSNRDNNTNEQFKIEIYSCDPAVGYFGQEYKLNNIFGNKQKYIQIDEYGNQHYSLQTTLVFKLKNNRPKDQNDIAILKKVLNKQ